MFNGMDLPRRKLNLRKISSIAGSFLMLLPGRPILYWGNMSVYVLSYIIIRQHGGVGIQPVWLSTMYSICWTLGMLISGCTSDMMGKRVVIIIGMFIFNLCIYLSYFTLRTSVTMFILVYGSLTGFGNGIGEGLLFKNFVVPWSSRDTGRLTSIVISAAEFGAVIMDQFVTLYVNPDNASTNITKGNLNLFTQQNILNKVPSMFLIQGFVSSVVQVLGFCLIREKKTTKLETETSRIRNELMEEDSLVLEDRDTSLLTSYVPNEDITSSAVTTATHDDRNSVDGLTPKEMLKCPLFYGLWFIYFSSTTSRTVLNTYYKIYGQTYIHDDHFLTNLGTTMTFFAAAITLTWGFIMDNVSLKICHIIIQTILALTNLFLYFAPMFNRWVYFLVCVLLTSATAPLYMLFTVSLILIFGKDSLNVKMAIASTAPLASSLVAAPISEAILPRLGWFALFLWPGVLAILSLILVICVFSET